MSQWQSSKYFTLFDKQWFPIDSYDKSVKKQTNKNQINKQNKIE